MQSLCVLIPSEDASKDIAGVVDHYSQAIWPFPVFRFYGGPDWRTRTIEQLDSLPPQYSHVLLVVEDCVFTAPIDWDRLSDLAEAACSFNLTCLRLTPVARNAIQRLFMLDCGGFHKLDRDEPYYSSWLIAIWRRDHLRMLVEKSATIYEFEHQVPDEEHYAVCKAFLKYECLVGKRMWYRWAARRYTLPHSRSTQPLTVALRTTISNISFQLFGFTSFRIRRWLKMHVYRPIS